MSSEIHLKCLLIKFLSQNRKIKYCLYFSIFDQKVEKTKQTHTQRENWLFKYSNLPVFVLDMGILFIPVHKVYNTKWCVTITAFTWG